MPLTVWSDREKCRQEVQPGELCLTASEPDWWGLSLSQVEALADGAGPGGLLCKGCYWHWARIIGNGGWWA